MGTTSADLFLVVDRSRPRRLRVQVEDELRRAIRSGRIAPGASLPSTRALAADLGVTRNVVVEAYDQLVAEGYLAARRGSGTVVTGGRPLGRPTVPSPQAGPAIEVDFRTGRPDLDLFPRVAWGRATRAALQALPSSALTDEDRRGLPELRARLVDYLGRARGVHADAEQVVVCAGFGHGLALVLGALVRGGSGRRIDGPVAVEDPGYAGPREQLAAFGIPAVGVPVDADGLVVEALRRSTARLVVVTPAHQSPTGVVLSPDRRHELVAWAEEVDGYVVEDDYDAEYRYDRRPVGAVQGIAPDRVVYGGTTSKTLASGVRLGWLVLPRALVEPVVAHRSVTDGASSTLLQASYAAFLASGDLHRHLRRSRIVYRERRDALVDALRATLPGAVPRGIAAGLNVLLSLPPEVDEQAVVEHGLARGVRCQPLSAFRVASSPRDVPGLVLGYGSVTPTKARRGVELLARAIDAATRPPYGEGLDR